MTARGDLNQKPEFSRVVKVTDLGTGPQENELSANAVELTALAERFAIDGLDSLEARVFLTLLPNADVRVDAAFTARVRQTCTVTLDPMESDVSAEFTMTYSQNADEGWGHDEEEFQDLDDHTEPPEPLIDEKIDIGEAVSEQLALEIDPFPRVKGTVFDGFSTGPKGEAEAVPEKKNPFAVLSQLKTKQENKE